MLLMLSSLSPSPLYAQELTFEQALSAVDESSAAVRFGMQQDDDFRQRKVSECQERMLKPLIFDAPNLSCSVDHLLTPLQRQKLLVLRRFLDVLLADGRAGLENEALAIAFIDFDRTQTRMQLGQRSELDVSQFQSLYQPVRVRFTEGEKSQRLSRELLALAQGKPGELSADVEIPDFNAWLQLPETETKEMIARALQSNPVLQKVTNETPLHEMMRDQLRYSIIEIMQALDVMQIEMESAQALIDYRDLYLDRSRTLYELEVKADLGDSMVEQTGARLAYHETLYQLVMLRATLNALQGYPLDKGLKQDKEE
ncbi:hypothetical protein BOV90_00360 [Solemya velum gill symbiont]|uniref:Outer membrane protein n=2 Tax=Solemya velum gill symbiont TaxID=2340 RepID=A0A0B0HDJ5_SOVGS|nr:hypothetical protein JV46_20720 [Solemya velum gill symbiont]OOY34492.1 hypothetical protein BOV88_10085 [Solemya velum gill symbiont]OOY37204.1 hypothetical protein BOV89_08925 [Solemya velum gill symbiont]OOY41217.1 hypothetical protein BOV90_00360 [Solemya velum gill symbiont]OOY43789.1 hypothetical protein BOV92_10365 [Solemya velum gill symbiont]